MSQNAYATLHAHLIEAVRTLVPGIDPAALARIELTPTKSADHGDMATNAALIAAKSARRPPAAIAADLAPLLAAHPAIEAAEPAGPGFVNLRLTAATLHATIPAILASGIAYGASDLGQNTPVNIEYVSANPTGPLTVGHCRGAVVGDALASLLAKAGYEVTREFYVNDAGKQVEALAWTTYWRYLQALGTTLTEDEFTAQSPSGLQYRGDYLIAIGQALAEEFGPAYAAPGLAVADPAAWLALFQSRATATLLAEIKTDLARLGVHQDVFTSERAILAEGLPDQAIAELDAQGLLYQGILEPPKGKLPEDWEPREQTLFASTRFGDDVDRPLRKSDGTNTYFANDLGYHLHKLRRGFPILIDVLGADHGGYVSRLRAAVAALSQGRAEIALPLCQIVHVLKGGQPVRMSKRAGTYVTLADLLDEAGKDATRFTMLMRKNDAQMEFDIDAAIAMTRDNPVFYVQYAHARCCSVLRTAAAGPYGSLTPESLAEADLTLLADEAELAVLRRLLAWPRTVEGAAQSREPHRIAYYLYDLAGDFHMLWHKGQEAATLRFLLPESPAATRARLALVLATATALRSGLAVLGVTPVEEMR